jgi:phage-related protein
MPPVEIRLWCTSSGRVPLYDLLDRELRRQPRIVADITAAIEELGRLGHEMDPSDNEHLGSQLHYLRLTTVGGEFRVFNWPNGPGVWVVGPGFQKKSRRAPPEEIERARTMRAAYLADRKAHTHKR